MLLYGPWGVGKTICACRVGQRPLHLVTEPSDDSLRDWPELRARTDVVEYGGVRHLGLIAEAFKTEYYTNDTLIIDTASELVEHQLDTIRVNWTPPKNTRIVFTSKAGEQPFEITGTDDYNLLKNILRPTIALLCQLPINLIFIAHERQPTWTDEAKYEKQGTPLPPVRPDLPAQILSMIAKRVSVVGRMTREGDKRQLSFASDRRSKEEVKSRIKELDGKRMTDSEFLAIVERWGNQRD